MLPEETIERLAEILVDRIEELNTTILEEVGKSIAKIGTLKPSDAYKLAQDLKYGASYNKIIKKLEKITNLNRKQIEEIFEEVAKKNQNFAKQFYDYREIDFIPYDENQALKQVVNSMASLTAGTYLNLSRTSAYYTLNSQGRKVLTPIARIYQDTIDKAVMSLAMGQDTYYTSMRKIMNTMAKNGVRTVDYASGRSMRLDSAVRMNVMQGIRNLSSEMQRQFGEEFGADGVEISVHENPAPDHENAQGHQFSYEEYDKLQNGLDAKDYKGKTITLLLNESGSYRPIEELNCMHVPFQIVLGVNEPQYSQEQLDEINKRNDEGFEFEGKHYTMYEGTQLQRQIETKIRTLKDEHIGLVSIGDEESLLEAGKIQGKIQTLNKRYKSLSDISGLPTKKNRMTVSGYRRIKKPNIKILKDINKPLDNIEDIAKYINGRKNELYGLDVKANQLKLNERNNFNEKPTLIDENIFDSFDDDLDYSNPEKAKSNQYIKVYRGWEERKYYDKYINGENSYGTGGYIDGAGTYATDNEWSAWQFANDDDELFMEIAIPGNAKFISREKLAKIHCKIYEEFNNNRELYLKKYGNEVVDILDIMNENISSTAVLNNYDIIYNNPYRNWVLLNRGIIKVKKK